MNTKLMSANYIVIDIEASGFGEMSYPIEFAWGNAAIGIESFLINPSNVVSWNYWSSESERIHNICRSDLYANGIDPLLAWNRINELFVNYRVYSDKPRYDAGWLKAFSILDVDTSIIQVHDSGDLIRRNLDAQGLYCVAVEQVYSQAAEVMPPTHRAFADVAYVLQAVEISESVVSL